MASGEVGNWRAHRLVGPGYRIGAVTHLRYTAPPYILAKFAYFLGVGLCSREVSSLQDTWHCQKRRMRSRYMEGRQLRGPESTGLQLEHVRQSRLK